MEFYIQQTVKVHFFFETGLSMKNDATKDVSDSKEFYLMQNIIDKNKSEREIK